MDITPYMRRAYYYETDKMGIIHHSNYIRWMEEARMDYLKKCGLDYDMLEEQGLMLPVVSVDCRYRSSVHFDEDIEIVVHMTALSALKVSFSHDIYRVINGQRILAASGNTVHCFLQATDAVPINIKRHYKQVYETGLALLEENNK